MHSFVAVLLFTFLVLPASKILPFEGDNYRWHKSFPGIGSRGALGRADSLRPGDQAPTFVMRDVVTGEPVYLRDYTGTVLREDGKTKKERQVVVLSFWATWCQPCKQEIPHLMKIALEFEQKPVKFFLVDAREQVTEDSVKTVLASRGYTLQCLVDATGRFAEKYAVFSLPVLVIIDKYGVVRKVSRGYQENFEAEVVKLLDTLVAQ
jgi:thiol-disulfide isomerase/thioredoxin